MARVDVSTETKIVTANATERQQALERLFNELKKGIDSEKEGLYSQEEVALEFGIKL